MKQEIKERIEKIQKGEVPEGYRKSKMGIIPENWEIRNIKYIISEKISDGPHETPKFKENGVPFLSVDSIQNGEIIFKNTRFISIEDHNIYKKKCFPRKDDILMGKAASVGKIARVKTDKEFSIWSPLALIRPNKELIEPSFLENILKGYSVQHQILIISNKSSQMNIGMKDIPKILLHLPEKKEQKKIAEIISTWDKAIELKEKLIEEKKEFKRGLIQKLLVGKIRFKEYVKNPNLQEVRRYSTLPEDWSIKKASSIFSNISKKNNDNEKLLSATQDNGVIPRDMLDGDVMSPSGDTNGYKLVEVGDFIISLRTFQGGIEYSCYRGIISPAYTVIKNKIPICADFYRYIFKSKLFIDRLASSVIGIRDGKQISYGDFSFMFLPYPELKEQEKIALSLNNLDDNIELLKLELNHLKEEKRGLMQLLLTGIVRVEVD